MECRFWMTTSRRRVCQHISELSPQSESWVQFADIWSEVLATSSTIHCIVSSGSFYKKKQKMEFQRQMVWPQLIQHGLVPGGSDSCSLELSPFSHPSFCSHSHKARKEVHQQFNYMTPTRKSWKKPLKKTVLSPQSSKISRDPAKRCLELRSTLAVLWVVFVTF